MRLCTYQLCSWAQNRKALNRPFALTCFIRTYVRSACAYGPVTEILGHRKLWSQDQNFRLNRTIFFKKNLVPLRKSRSAALKCVSHNYYLQAEKGFHEYDVTLGWAHQGVSVESRDLVVRNLVESNSRGSCFAGRTRR